jgi:hypothetical protein
VKIEMEIKKNKDGEPVVVFYFTLDDIAFLDGLVP